MVAHSSQADGVAKKLDPGWMAKNSARLWTPPCFDKVPATFNLHSVGNVAGVLGQLPKLCKHIADAPQIQFRVVVYFITF